ncbi:MAG: ferredoxin family protein [Acidobacteriota bacterium]|nr:ferredoxin family protein [Acidobacteriota bacterium]
MTAATQTREKIVFCNCAYTRILPTKVKEKVRNQLIESGVEFEDVEDMCRMAAERDPKLAEMTEGETVKIAACYPRAVKWLFHAAGADLDEEKVDVLNMREQEAGEICEALLGEAPPEEPEEARATEPTVKPTGEWKPWFPVIDYDRCTNCMQCLSFCLFDVYGVSDERKIAVQNPTKCKTDCPACSRVCPEAAILFPKYRQGPINGAPVSDEDLRREKMQVDITSLLGGDIYSLLRDRSTRARSRFSRERDDERALKERKRCLKKLQDKLGIPEEVMNALPSVDAIQAKAAAVFDKTPKSSDR